MKHPLAKLSFALVSMLSLSAASGANWPGWRGPEGTGVSTGKNLPQSWTTSENVRWKIALPGPGNSSPIVWGDRVFVTQSIKSENRRTLMCLDRKSGKLLWQSGVTYTEEEPTQQSNPYCSATPVTDGARVIALFGSAGLYCYDFQGKDLWHSELGKMTHMFGNAASPILYKDLCFVNFGPDEKARLVAVNKTDGKTAWEAEPPKVDPSEQPQMQGGPGGGPGGPGGRGGFGPGMFVAPQMLTQADKNGDEKVTKEEFTALADAWYDKLDAEKSGKLSQDQFTERLSQFFRLHRDSGLPKAEAGLPKAVDHPLARGAALVRDGLLARAFSMPPTPTRMVRSPARN